MKIKVTALCALVLFFFSPMNSIAKPVDLRCEYLTNPLGIDVFEPALSWRSDDTARNWRQTGYQLLVASSPELLNSGKPDVWDSGKRTSSESTGIGYHGPALTSRQRYYWTVRVWDAKGHKTQAAEVAWWETGLLDPSDWTAQWIGWHNPEDALDRAGIKWIWSSVPQAALVTGPLHSDFHLDFDLAQLPIRATLFLIARGDWGVTVNGREAGDKQHWNEFDRREIGALLVQGKNSIDIHVTVPASGMRSPYPPALAALLKIRQQDGAITRFPTDVKWQARSQESARWLAATVLGNLDGARFGDAGMLPQPAALLRKQFTLEKQILRARVYATALGGYDLFINGKRISNDVLTPGFTDFSKRVQYQTYEVSHLLTKGSNVIGAMLGNGWFGSGLSWTAEHFSIKPPTRFLAQLEIDFTDGSRQIVQTDTSWRSAQSPILHSEIYAGETYDARLEQPGWNTAGFDDHTWQPVALADAYKGSVSSQLDTPPRIVKILRPETVKEQPDGSYVFDMGQNMVGWAALKVKGQAGTTVRLRFAEILKPDGGIYTTNLRNADATDFYTLSGKGEETFAPHFTFHGFRYIEVSGYPGRPTLDDLTGQVVSSLSGEPTGTISTPNEMVNRMWQIGIWGQRGNFLSVPTDCPQRDERLGWMADAAVFWRTGSYNFDIAAFSNKWTRDVRDAQSADGAFSNVSPSIGVGTIEGAPGWGDAGVIVPWTTWLQYGDRSIIDRNWAAMARWMDFIEQANPDYLRRNKVGPDFADWLAPDPGTPKPLVDTAYWAGIANMMSEMARATHRAADQAKYTALYGKIRTAFAKQFIRPDGQIGSGSQTSYVVALQMNLVPAALEGAAVNNLVASIDAHAGHLTTGFLGTPFLLFCLADHARLDVAYRLLLNDTYPSWGYMLSKGATTWWERWNGDTGDPAMNSYNHYAFGSVVAWIYRDVVGIDTTSAAPGFHRIIIHPRPDPRIPAARGSYQSAYGRITTDWNGTPGGPFTLKVSIPPNTTAKVYLPAAPNALLKQDGQTVHAWREGDSRVVEIGSGSYEFSVR
ncbi:MAG TPA: family 78 glycoside hydrolase catalytic domain [Bryobacteraceae bacterium]|nr:family 78 glycoside hydrolase catalytic domain [Bryobacteraceae bacterium]